MEEFLGFDDVVIVPGRSPVEPSSVDITGQATRNIVLSIPVISSPMDTVTEWRMAALIARLGGLGVIHRNMSIESQIDNVVRVKNSVPSIWSEIIKIGVDERFDIVEFRMREAGVDAGIVMSKQGFHGIFIRYGADYEYWANKVDSLVKLASLIKPMPTIDEDGRLRVGAAISPFDIERAKRLSKAGVDVLVVDVAHLHNVNALSSLRKLVREVEAEVVAGNLGTREGVLDTLATVEDIAGLRMGIASGSICITGEVSGTAVPTLTAVMKAREALQEIGLQGKIPIIADGGIRNPGDAAKAIIAGASSVMVGRVLAGAEEAPTPKVTIGDRVYKPYRGMASRGAMERRYASDRYSKPSKAVVEGVEGLVPYSGSAVNSIAHMAFGLQAALGYAGAANLREAWSSKLARITPSGGKEIKPHDLVI
ncbi:MAG: IMP dehydrogenase [Desulfurococcales archaeon]|nr:IMP dehydrogenase [Desulfurococcales archaeon]